MRYKIPFIVAAFGACCGCGAFDNEPYYVSEPYSYVADMEAEAKQKGGTVAGVENYDAFTALVEDSLCVFYTPRHPDGFFSVMDIRSGEDLGTYCMKGNGPQESTNMYNFSEISLRNGCLVAEVMDVPKERMFEWNITRSVEERRSIFDTIRPLKWIKAIGIPIDFYSRLDDNRFLWFP